MVGIMVVKAIRNSKLELITSNFAFSEPFTSIAVLLLQLYLNGP